MPNPRASSRDARALPADESRGRPRDGERELTELVQSARTGDSNAWTRLVQRFDRTLRQIARSYRLTPADVDEVVQATWLDLLESIERIREPAAIGAWLATTMRRNALRRKQRHVYEQLSDDPRLGDRPDADPPDASLLELERSAILVGAVGKLPARHRDLLMVLLTQPTLSYHQVSELLSIPVGSIGPIRARSLARLARDAQLQAISDSATTPSPQRRRSD